MIAERRLLSEGFPILVEYGEKHHALSSLMNETQQCDRLIHLKVEMGHNVHGSIKTRLIGDEQVEIEEITIQANVEIENMIEFDDASSQALAEHLYHKLTTNHKMPITKQ